MRIVSICLLFLLSATTPLLSSQLAMRFTSDVHSQLEASPESGDHRRLGGILRREEFLRQEREAYPNLILLDAGDAFSGSPYFQFFAGKTDIEAMNLLSYDVMAVGNHDFDAGKINLEAQLSLAKFPTLNGNIVYTTTGKPVFQGSVMLERDGVRVAILGLMSQSAWESIRPSGKTGLSLLDPLEVAKNWVAQTRPQADVVILLSHCGLEDDLKIAKHDLFDLIIGGHSHKILKEAILVPNKLKNGLGGTLVHQAGAFGHFVGKVDLTVEKGTITSCSSGIAAMHEGYDRETTSNLSIWLKECTLLIEDQMKAVVGFSKDSFSKGEGKLGPTPMGRLIAGALQEIGNSDIGVIYSGSIRGDIKAGPLTLRDMYSLFLDNDNLYLLKMRGDALEALIQLHAQRWGASKTMQFSGVTFDVQDHIAKNLLVNGQALQKNNFYTLTTTEYFIEREYSNLLEGKMQIITILDKGCIEAFVEYLRLHNPLTRDPCSMLKAS